MVPRKTGLPSDTDHAHDHGRHHHLHDREILKQELGRGFLFGVIFGFLLQKGGVAKYEVLIGMLCDAQCRAG
jgi:hypothetical protein